MRGIELKNTVLHFKSKKQKCKRNASLIEVKSFFNQAPFSRFKKTPVIKLCNDKYYKQALSSFAQPPV